MSWQKSFQLKEFADFWKVGPILFHDGSYGAIELKKELLEQGSQKTVMEWLSYSIKAAPQNQFYVWSAPLHYALTDLLCENEDHPHYKKTIGEIKTFLGKELQSNLYTLSVPFYRTSPAPDQINHFQGPKSYITAEHLFGTEGNLQQLWDADRICAALLGEEDSNRVNKVNQWLCSKDTYISREKNKSSCRDSGSVQIGIDAQHLRIEIGSPSTQKKKLPALGMRIRKLHQRRL